MENSKNQMMAELKAILKRAQIEPNAKYLTAKQVEVVYGIPRKTLLNRSNLPATHNRFIPSVRLKGGRKKYFERKVIDRMMKIGRPTQ